MKFLKTSVLILISLLLINGCDKPAPTELVKEEDLVDVEVLAKDTEDEFYSADSSGVVEDLNGFTNIVTVSGIKITSGNTTLNTAFAQAIFFDRSFPVRVPDGRLVGFRTRVLGNVQFNNVNSRLADFIVRFKNRNNGAHRDTSLGLKQVLNSFFPLQDFNYMYNSSVEFKLNPIIGSTVSISIPTPEEVTGTVKFEGRRTSNNLKALLQWSEKHEPGFEIILGVNASGSDITFPLFRMKTKDDSELIIPAELINAIPQGFDRIVFSFIRKKEFHREINNNDLYILSQSIHSVVVNIP